MQHTRNAPLTLIKPVKVNVKYRYVGYLAFCVHWVFGGESEANHHRNTIYRPTSHNSLSFRVAYIPKQEVGYITYTGIPSRPVNLL